MDKSPEIGRFVYLLGAQLDKWLLKIEFSQRLTSLPGKEYLTFLRALTKGTIQALIEDYFNAPESGSESSDDANDHSIDEGLH